MATKRPQRPVIETLKPIGAYTTQQLEQAISIARQLDRGKLTLVEPPRGGRRDSGT